MGRMDLQLGNQERAGTWTFSNARKREEGAARGMKGEGGLADALMGPKGGLPFRKSQRCSIKKKIKIL